MASTFTLPPELTIYTCGDTRPLLLAWLESASSEGGPLVIDGANVQELDGAGLQLLLSTRRSAAARGLPLDVQLGQGRLALARQLLDAAPLPGEPA